MTEQQQKFKEIEGFRDWSHYYQFAPELFRQLSHYMFNKEFDLIINSMREFIDNTVAYHSNSILVIEKDDKGKETKKNVAYEDYFEKIVDDYYSVYERTQNFSPQLKEQEISIKKDFFFKETRKIRRQIMKDLAISGITPQASEKRLVKRHEEMEGVGL